MSHHTSVYKSDKLVKVEGKEREDMCPIMVTHDF